MVLVKNLKLLQLFCGENSQKVHLPLGIAKESRKKIFKSFFDSKSFYCSALWMFLQQLSEAQDKQQQDKVDVW